MEDKFPADIVEQAQTAIDANKEKPLVEILPEGSFIAPKAPEKTSTIPANPESIRTAGIGYTNTPETTNVVDSSVQIAGQK